MVGQIPKRGFDQGALCPCSHLLSLDTAKIALAIISFSFSHNFVTKLIFSLIVCIGFICLHNICMFNTEMLKNIEKQKVKMIHYPTTWRSSLLLTSW